MVGKAFFEVALRIGVLPLRYGAVETVLQEVIMVK
jgi:hypothetical protein